MTTPNGVPQIPEPVPPVLTRMVSEAIFPNETTGKEAPIMWVLGQPHPLAPTLYIVRMMLETEGVEIYSVNSGLGVRNFIPLSRVRFTHEEMTPDILADEIEDAETEPSSPGDESEPDEDPEPEEAPANQSQPS